MLSVQKTIKGVYSPLYDLISKLIEEKFDYFNGENREKIENETRRAYLIPIHFPIENHLFETQAGFQDFLLEERRARYSELKENADHLDNELGSLFNKIVKNGIDK